METAIDIYSARKTPKISGAAPPNPCHGSFGGASRHLTPQNFSAGSMPDTAVIDSSIKSPTMNLTFLMRHAMLRASFFVSSDCHIINCSTARTTNGNSSLRTLTEKCLSVNRVTHKVISLALFCLSFGPDLISIILFNSSTHLYRTHIKCCQLCWYFNAH